MKCEWCNKSDMSLERIVYHSEVYKQNMICTVCSRCANQYRKSVIKKSKKGNKG